MTHQHTTFSEVRRELPPVVTDIEAAFRARDYAKTAELIEHDFLSVWFGVVPSRTAEIVSTLLRSSGGASPFVRLLGTMLFTEDLDDEISPAAAQVLTTTAKLGYPSQQLALIGRMYGLRLRGKPVEALAIAETLKQRDAPAPIIDPTRGWRLFSAVQHGVTAMLAGDFAQALASFTQARLQPAHPALGFLVRDACVKSAMIEVLYGDAQRAEALLQELERTPRTTSWAEEGIDAACQIVSSRLPSRDPSEAMRMLDSIQLSSLGEMWPFYIVAALRTSVEVGDLAESRRRIAILEKLELPRVNGQGFAGSVFPLSRALISIASGDLHTARKHLEKADPTSPDTGIILVFLELSANRPSEVLRRAAQLRASTLPLRLLELIRLALTASAYLALEDQQAWETVTRMAMAMPGGIRPQEAGLFPAEIQSVAKQHFPEWPTNEALTDIGIDLFTVHRAVLTRREVEIIQALGNGFTRPEIARAQFVSENTVKSHLRVIYRKLGVSSREAAVLEAERRGLLFT